MLCIAYDTEFLEDGRTIELISIGMVSSDGREYYAVNADMDQFRIQRHPWLLENVWPHLPVVERPEDPNRSNPWNECHTTMLDTSAACVKPKWVIANEVRDFILHHRAKKDGGTMMEVTEWGCDPGMKAFLQSDQPPRLWAYYGAYDHVALAQLYGPMVDLPAGIPMFTHDIMQLLEDNPIELPEQSSNEHNALHDARWNMMVLKATGVVP